MEADLFSVEYLKAISQPLNFNLESGIYFLFQNNELVYIGQAACFDIRLLKHITEGTKEFNRFSFIPLPPEQLDEAEAEYINKFRPKYNKYIPSILGYLSKSTLQAKFKVKQSQIRKVIKKYQPKSINGRYQVEEIERLLKEEGYL